MKKQKTFVADDDKRMLFIRDFPTDLSDQCLAVTGQKVLTRAVLQCLRDYFSLKKLFQAERTKRQDLQSDFDLIFSFFRAEDELRLKREKVLKILSDPNRFYLHGD